MFPAHTDHNEATMATPALTPTLLSIDEYLHTSYKPDVDFIDGAIEERNLGEFEHARLQTILASFFVVQ